MNEQLKRDYDRLNLIRLIINQMETLSDGWKDILDANLNDLKYHMDSMRFNNNI